LMTAVRAYGALEEHGFHWKVAKDMFRVSCSEK
jgi:hypothetical protein